MEVNETHDQRPPSSSRPSLPFPLRLLFSFNGAIFILPNLALLSIVNDRAAIPPQYLPAYGALSFLPWSVKPLYAYLSTLITVRWGLLERHALIAILLGLSGLSFVLTAFIPVGGVIMCFVCGFVRGICGSWPEFLLGLTLIDTARDCAERTTADEREDRAGVVADGNTVADGMDEDDDDAITSVVAESAAHRTSRYQEIVTYFQAQAATARNIGSLSAGTATFLLFAWRHFRHTGGTNTGSDEDDEPSSQPELSDLVVTALLLVTAALPLVGSAIAMRYKVGSVSYHPHSRGRQQQRGAYNAIYKTEDATTTLAVNDEHNKDIVFTSPLEINDEDELFAAQNEPQLIDEQQRRSHYEVKEHKYYAVTLLFFQTVLIWSSLKSPLIAATSHTAWLVILVSMSLCLLASAISASYYERKKNKIYNRDAGNEHSSLQIPAKRLAIYLLLRHSLPSSGYIFYSFLFTLFESSPLFMQILSILGSAGATCSSWFYGRFLSKNYSSGWSILGVIVVTSIIYSLTSLFNVFIYRSFGESGADEDDKPSDLRMLLVIAPIYFLTGVVAELNFMPSLVLATTNVVADSNKERKTQVADEGQSLESREDNQSSDHNSSSGSCPSLFDEGMQYAGFVSCIDFGEQVGSWLTVPIASALDITRDNNFANLDSLILICAAVYLISLGYLCVIRPRSDVRKHGADIVSTEVAGGIIT